MIDVFARRTAKIRSFAVGQNVRTASGSLGVVTMVDVLLLRVLVKRPSGEEQYDVDDLEIVPPRVANSATFTDTPQAGGMAHVEALEKRIAADEALNEDRIGALEARLTALEAGAEAWTRTERDRADCEEDRKQRGWWARKVDARLMALEQRGAKPELPNPGVEFELRTDRDAIEAILAKIRTILGTPDQADVVEQAERVVVERDAAMKAAGRSTPDEPGLARSVATAQTPRHKELVATFGRGVGADVYIAELLESLPDLVRRAAGEIRDRTLREALLADLEALLLHPRKS